MSSRAEHGHCRPKVPAGPGRAAAAAWRHLAFWSVLALIVGEMLILVLYGAARVEKLMGGSIAARISYRPLFENLDVSVLVLWLIPTLPLALAAYRLRPWRGKPRSPRHGRRQEPRL